MIVDKIVEKALAGERISVEEGLFLYENASLPLIMDTASRLRNEKTDKNIVTWQIDRNINITNICTSFCQFCNFCRTAKSEESYTLSFDEYIPKIQELIDAGGDQILLQGGLNPKLGIVYYSSLFTFIKKHFPTLKIHALGPPEVAYIAQIDGMTIDGVLDTLLYHGLTSLPGAGAEILNDRVRGLVSPAKCDTNIWLQVMEIAHKKGVLTSATMMFGHLETMNERIEHLDKIRKLQDMVPQGMPGFKAFIPWPVQLFQTRLQEKSHLKEVSNTEYIKTVAISRIMLDNIANIQASWLTVGIDSAQMALHAGANDMGSIMMEENVVASAGVNRTLNATQMQDLITKAGFTPRKRNQAYELCD